MEKPDKEHPVKCEVCNGSGEVVPSSWLQRKVDRVDWDAYREYLVDRIDEEKIEEARTKPRWYHLGWDVMLLLVGGFFGGFALLLAVALIAWHLYFNRQKINQEYGSEDEEGER